MKFICTLLVVTDIMRSRNFYEVLLGQTVKFDFGENVTYIGDFAIHLQSHYSQLIDEKPIHYGGNNVELYFENNDVDSVVEKLKDNGIDFIHEAREQPWRQKVVRFFDPDKHIIEIGESLEYLSYRLSVEGLTDAEISSTVGIPVEFVRSSIDNIKKVNEA